MQTISLNGRWQMREAGTQAWHSALVPGSVYADLLRDGTIPDPFWRENEREVFELLRRDYEYVRTFTVDAADLAHERILLSCKGLDTLCTVILNGEEIARTDNMHVTWEWDVKQRLHPGDNTLMLLFASPIEFALAAYEKSPGWHSSDAIPGFQHIRKAHCMFGWDWGPRLPDAGVWRDIELLLVDDARLTSVLVEQEHAPGQVTLRLTPEIDGRASAWSARITAPDGRVIELPEQRGESAQVVIDAPQLWWPAGYGEQPLYTVEVTLLSGDAVQDVWTRRIGLRTLTVSREKDEAGEEFCHVVNGVRIFAMGADYIPEDNILSRVTPQRTRRLLEDARLANMNIVRIWGGGYYPGDEFYDVCDELGLMVWQDLMYACAFYDLTPAFEASIRLETEQNVRRLRHHASLALICGNNEDESFVASALNSWVNGREGGFEPKRASHFSDYTVMYDYILPGIVKRVAPQTFWWPSSPSSGGSFEAPNDPNRGDVHYWDVWHGEKPFTDYRNYLFRYVSEFGFQSFPCLSTVESFTLPGDRNLFSRIMERHQRNGAANGKILAYLAQTFRYPTSFDSVLYASQLLQAEAIRYGVEHWRRHRGRCMGAVIWQLNDCWPVASWASLDYYGRWKALHYAAKRFFAPVLLSCEETGELSENPRINEFHPAPIDCSARLNVCNETMQPVSGTVRWALRRADGSILRAGEEAVSVPALSACWLDKLDFTGQIDLTSQYLSYELVQEGRVTSAGTALFCAPKHFDFVDPALRVRLDGDEVVVTAQAFARQVCIESSDPDLLLEDNFFDMNGGERRVRILRGSAEQLRVRSVFDLGVDA